ncbi:hypothetical protein HK099_005070 [Clydaea vesicula]|uniref:Uncharacterized protein n=1 Tax=Clydaea vesicula TaxID=447962 RepID=A0AAD5XZT9_9FUNG|nr:hypothetical protein HK099_005070 [Clydaea vesicula]KAJ3394615.1 hypothetical protein HDU92_006720 [Lobulomyces angularis]
MIGSPTRSANEAAVLKEKKADNKIQEDSAVKTANNLISIHNLTLADFADKKQEVPSKDKKNSKDGEVMSENKKNDQLESVNDENSALKKNPLKKGPKIALKINTSLLKIPQTPVSSPCDKNGSLPFSPRIPVISVARLGSGNNKSTRTYLTPRSIPGNVVTKSTRITESSNDEESASVNLLKNRYKLL